LRDEFKRYGIGDTVLLGSNKLEKLLGFSKIFLKFEGGNPSGTMKDRASYACLRLAAFQGHRKLVIASCGNFGASFVHMARLFNIEAHVYIPEGYHTSRIVEIEDKGGLVHWVPGTYEEVVEFSSEEAEKLGWFNANPGVKANTEASLAAYATISYEILMSLGYAPDVVAVPVGNGTTIAGIYTGFNMLHEGGLWTASSKGREIYGILNPRRLRRPSTTSR
jgi:threonine synthase